ncbi:glycosyltransferase [Microvirga sp. 2MCAF38]|uniref:glycosyltransferase n=1 Tax=Microvirga sp. 2MCAF38 TaxID=3232989 RepID=UPI003F988167
MHERATTSAHAYHSLRASSQKPLLVCYSHLRWDFVWQRPQHLMTRAAKNYDVLVIEEPILEVGATPHMRVSQRGHNLAVAVPILPEGLSPTDVLLHQHNLVEDLIDNEDDRARVFWYYTPMAIAFTRGLECDLCVYDNMDELSLFHGASHELMLLERDLFERADLVFTGGLSLYEAKRRRHRNVHAFPSSIDAAHFAAARRGRCDPGDQANIPFPRLGFFGVIDERMDTDLLDEVAQLRPDWQFVMIGPIVKIDPKVLPRHANIHWLGPKSYCELPVYLAGWDAGFMPFALNDATRFISPTKTPEFLAAGLPVISTRIADVVRPYGEKGLVEIADNARDVVARAEAILKRPKELWLAKVDRQLATGSWDKTWASMHQLMLSAMESKATRHAPISRLAVRAE